MKKSIIRIYWLIWRFLLGVPGGFGLHGSGVFLYFKLGLYRTALQKRYIESDLLSLFAVSVSLAACGKDKESHAAANKFVSNTESDDQRESLAKAFAPYMPQLALSIVQQLPSCSLPLKAGLLLRNGQQEAAKQLLIQAMQDGLDQRHPELNLMQGNAFLLAPKDRLQRLNAFLAAHNVAPLALLNPQLPPNPVNLRVQEAVTPVHGPLVTVIMTTHGSSQRVSAAVASVLGQSWRNLELIVVDDASTDDTVSVLSSWALRDARMRVLQLPRNVGTFAAKTLGLQLAQGEFVTCHDSDDWSHPLKIERQVRPLLRRPWLVASTSLWVRMQDDGHYYARQVYPLMRINPSSPLFRREPVLDIMGGWDSGVRTGADSEFLARLKLVFGRKAVKRIAQPLALGAHRPDSLMTAQATGYDASGMSPVRLDYWEAWGHWHLNCLRHKLPLRMPVWGAPRAFEAPAAIAVNPEHMRVCMAAVQAMRST